MPLELIDFIKVGWWTIELYLERQKFKEIVSVIYIHERNIGKLARLLEQYLWKFKFEQAAKTGATVRKGASAGGKAKAAQHQAQHSQWQKAASEIWARRPDLSKQAVAGLIRKQFGGRAYFKTHSAADQTSANPLKLAHVPASCAAGHSIWAALAGAFRRLERGSQSMTLLPNVLRARDAARVLGLSESTLAKLRLSGKGPPYCKLGRRVLYQPHDLSTWLS